MPLNVATQVAGKVLHCARWEKFLCNVAKRVAESRTDFYFSQRLQQQKNCDIEMSVAGYVTLGNISCNFCRNKIARQVAREIAWCNSALIKA